ncbi:MAG: M18 family aminopeptidase [Parachlamydiaceae bacterium]
MTHHSETSLDSLIAFLKASPTAWHAVENARELLTKAGFQELEERDPWTLSPKKKYFTIRNGSSLIAFKIPKQPIKKTCLLASHTDSPSLKLKTNAAFIKENMLMLGVEVYGSPLLSSWLNRDLGIAGRCIGLNQKNELRETLINIQDHPLTIPQLAIHLDRKINDEGLVLNKQEHLPALFGINAKEEAFRQLLVEKAALQKLLAYDLFLYPLEEPRLLGIQKELLASYRIDSLASVSAILEAFLAKESVASQDELQVMAVWDNEEIGSSTAQAAGSPFLPHVLERIHLSLGLKREDYLRLLPQSFCLSIDLAHAVHPNHLEKFESRHRVYLKDGIAIKSHPSAYATNGLVAAQLIKLAEENNIHLQHFVSRSDMPSGSTIGPIQATLTGIPTIDLGIAQLSMHSARELIAVDDYLSLVQLLKAYLNL